jgi:RNA polymerase sigma factor (sigma-70 family)
VGGSEEIAQETFIVAWTRLGQMQQPERVRGWLCGIARMVSRRALHKQRRHARRSADYRSGGNAELASAEPSPLDQMIGEEDERWLWRALERIPEVYRLPLVLFYCEEQSIEDVARALDVTVSSVKTRLFRGRRMLAKHRLANLASTLRRTLPGKAFSAAVLAAIASLSSTARAAPRAAGPRVWLQGTAALLVAAAVPGAVVVSTMTTATATEDEAPFVEPRRTPNRPPVWSPTVHAPSPAPTPLFHSPDDLPSFDFEDGVLPEDFRYGHVVAGPPRPGNRFCLLGIVSFSYARRSNVTLVAPDSRVLFSYSPETTLSFDYWAGRGTGLVLVVVTSHGRNYNVIQRQLVHEAWGHMTVRLDELRAKAVDSPPLAEGAPITRLELFGATTAGAPFYVDNVRLHR